MAEICENIIIELEVDKIDLELTAEQQAMFRGNKGDTGSQGLQGEKGDKGDKGDKGEKGDAGGIQVQSDMAQEDDTQLDFIKNKISDYIDFNIYADGELAITESFDWFFWFLLGYIEETYYSFESLLDRKQDPLEDISVTIYYSSWVDNEATVYANIFPNDKLWYSPTLDSYDDFVEAELRMTEQGNGYVKFKCETTPEENIDVLIRRA